MPKKTLIMSHKVAIALNQACREKRGVALAKELKILEDLHGYDRGELTSIAKKMPAIFFSRPIEKRNSRWVIPKH